MNLLKTGNTEKSKEKPTSPPSKGAGGIHNRYLPYNKKLKQFSKNLRNDSTRSEIALWQELRGAKTGYTFNRQKPILNYIVDFYCKPLNLVIEADGISHWDKEQIKKDQIRQEKLEKLGLHFLRFDDDEILNDMENILRVIEITIEDLEQIYPEARKRRKDGERPKRKRRTRAERGKCSSSRNPPNPL
ncbi:MAG: endonuclease domain-containing protein [Bacteroidales bacterium]|nr:endonuclease domain-containing protein [Bacteroidales bacterium]